MSNWTYNDGLKVVGAGAARTYRVSRAAAEFALSADSVRRQQGVGAVRGGADAALKFRKLKAEVGIGALPMEEKLFAIAGDTMVVTGLALSAIALPTMAKKTATSFRELKDLIHNPTATAEQRLNKVEELARASGGTIFAAQGVKLGTAGTVGILSRNQGIARVVAVASDSKVMRFVGTPLGKALNILLPVADVAVLIGETIATRRIFNDPTATVSQKLRKSLDLSLALVKTSFWVLPQARALKTLYAVASFGQLALTVKDFWPQMQPTIAKVGSALAFTVAHPIDAAGNVAKASASAVGWVATKTVGAIGWTADKVLHPVTTWNKSWTEISVWTKAWAQARGQQITQIFDRNGNVVPQTQLAAATQPVAPTPVTATPTPFAYAAPAPLAPAPAPIAPPAPAPAPAPMVAAAPAPAPLLPAAPVAVAATVPSPEAALEGIRQAAMAAASA